MSYKSALAGLSYGGGKAVILQPEVPFNRQALFKTYAERVNLLNGNFITGEDVGITHTDLRTMQDNSKFIIGVTADPVIYTCLGVYYGILQSLNELYGNESIENRSFAIQGVGKTGEGLLKYLYPDARKIYISDVNDEKMKEIKEKYPKVELVSPKEIDTLEVDVFSPCAMFHTINSKNIDHIKAKIIAGSANNQLENQEVGTKLFEKGIIYAPDYVINAGGLITVVDEYEYKSANVKRIMKRVSRIKETMEAIIDESKKTHTATNIVADKMAERTIVFSDTLHKESKSSKEYSIKKLFNSLIH